MRKYPYDKMKEWAGEAGVPVATYIGVISVHEAKTSKSSPEIRLAAVELLGAFLESTPAHGLPPDEVAVKIGLKPIEHRFVLYHTRKLLLKRAQAKGMVQ